MILPFTISVWRISEQVNLLISDLLPVLEMSTSKRYVCNLSQP
jgi:hypothetical protein